MDRNTRSNAMDTNNLLWVLGHKIRLLDTDESYGMVEITSPPHVPGPPPHFHKSGLCEFARRRSIPALDGTITNQRRH